MYSFSEWLSEWLSECVSETDSTRHVQAATTTTTTTTYYTQGLEETWAHVMFGWQSIFVCWVTNTN